jgi:rod shape-determining protein MreC
MYKKPRFIVFLVLVVLVLLVLSLPSRTAVQLKLALGGIFLPLFGLSGSAHHLADKAGQALVPRQALQAQIDQLRRENQTLRLEAMQGEEALRENARLRQLLGFAQSRKWNLTLARVIARDPANWWHSLTIDKGSRDGLRTNLPVLAPEGLVGRVSTVGYSQSQVVLVGDPNCLVAAVVEAPRDAGRDTGVIEPGPASWDSSFVQLTHLSRSSNLKPGQHVFTWGQGGIFPAGIYIGEVVDTHSMESGLYREARVKLGVNLNRLEDVGVLMP